MRVLLIEDEPDLRALITEELEQAATVTTASSGTEARSTRSSPI